MLLLILKWLSWPLGRPRLWVTVPLLLGAAAMLAGAFFASTIRFRLHGPGPGAY